MTIDLDGLHPEALLTADQFAEVTGYTRGYLAVMRHRKTGPTYQQHGRRVFYTVATARSVTGKD